MPSFSFVLMASAVAVPGGAVLPARYAHVELALDEGFEQLDLASSVQYWYATYQRAFNTDSAGIELCEDGSFLKPALLSQCPNPSDVDSLPSCDNSTEGEMCIPNGACGSGKSDLGNCPRLEVANSKATVLIKSRTCQGAIGARFCNNLARGISTVALITTLSGIVLPLLHTGIYIDDPCMGVLCSVVPGVIVASVTLPVTWAVSPPAALIVVAVLLGCCFIYTSIVHICWFCDIDWNDGEDIIQRRRRWVSAVLPLFGVYAGWRMGPEIAAELRENRKNMKLHLKMQQDLPEMVVVVIDMYYFGASWFATFDVVVNVLGMVYHLLVRSILGCIWCKKELIAADANFARSIGAPVREDS